MKKIITVILSLLLVAGLSACSVSSGGPKAISLDISDRDVDVQYMIDTDMSVFGAHNEDSLDMEGTLHIDFSKCEEFEADENLMLVSGTGELAIYSRRYAFDFEDELMSRVRVSDTNTVYESIISSSIKIGGRAVKISIDLVADEDFRQAVATISAEDGVLFFGDIFNDYLEYFNMILAGALNE